MSRRYVSPDQISIEQEFDLVHGPWEFPAHYNVAPSNDVPVIRVVEGQPDPTVLTWGFGEHDTANLPVEMLRSDAGEHALLVQGQRCIVPAMGFYAWRAARGGARTPFYVHVEDQAIFGFAGFWERERCTIITLPANAMMAEVDNVDRRMPAILSRDARDVCLYGSVVNAAATLVPYPGDRLIAYGVSARVDSLDSDDETLIEPLETDVD